MPPRAGDTAARGECRNNPATCLTVPRNRTALSELRATVRPGPQPEAVLTAWFQAARLGSEPILALGALPFHHAWRRLPGLGVDRPRREFVLPSAPVVHGLRPTRRPRAGKRASAGAAPGGENRARAPAGKPQGTMPRALTHRANVHTNQRLTQRPLGDVRPGWLRPLELSCLGVRGSDNAGIQIGKQVLLSGIRVGLAEPTESGGKSRTSLALPETRESAAEPEPMANRAPPHVAPVGRFWHPKGPR